MNSINEILNRNCYLIFASVVSVLHRHHSKTKMSGPKNRENCFQTANCFFDSPQDSNFILNHFCIEGKCCLL